MRARRRRLRVFRRLAAAAAVVMVLLAPAGARPAQGNRCPLPEPEQAVVYEDEDLRGACALLGLGKHTSFPPVDDNQVSSLTVGANTRVVLYDRFRFEPGGHTYYEGGSSYPSLGDDYWRNRTSAIEVFRASGGPAATLYKGDYPRDQENFYSNNLQGLAHDNEHWFITTTDRIYRIPLSFDLSTGKNNPGFPSLSIPVNGYNHFGDPDVDREHGILYVPLTGPPGKPPRIAAFRTTDFEYISSDVIGEQSDSGWVAVDPILQELWTSESQLNGRSGLLGYKIHWVGADLALIPLKDREIILKNRSGVPVDIRFMQGGVFNPERSLFYQVNGLDSDIGGDGARIRVFDMSGTLQARSSNGAGPFRFENHAGGGCKGRQEPEGLDFFDVTDDGIPGIPDGQLHAFLVNEGCDHDDVWMKHYSLPPVIYSVAATTGDFIGAGTDANVFITLVGSRRASDERQLDDPRRNDFEQGSRDGFLLAGMGELGSLTEIRIRHDNGGFAPGWYANEIRVRNERTGRLWRFPVHRWLATDECDGQIELVLRPNEPPEAPGRHCRTTTLYSVTVTTGDFAFAGTDANVFVTLMGSDGQGEERLLDDPERDEFERAETDAFVLEGLREVGALAQIRIRHDNKRSLPGWYPQEILVRNERTGKKWRFPIDRWLATDECEGKIELILKPDEEPDAPGRHCRM